MDPRIFGAPPTQIGEKIDGVFQVGVQSRESAALLPFGTCFTLCGVDLTPGRYTFYGLVVVGLGDDGCLATDSSTRWYSVDFPDDVFPQATLELAAGFGGMGIGAAFLGGQTVAAVDFNALAVRHLSSFHGDRALQIDLCAPNAASSIHAVCPEESMGATFGFPCQPYSSQGLCRGATDERALVLHAGLRVAWLTQVKFLVLECVSAAQHDRGVQEAIADITSAMGWQIQQVVLDLATQWPCRRVRWWAALMPKDWSCDQIPQWPPANEDRVVGDILPRWGIWTETDEMALHLSADELACYADPRYGSDQRILTTSSVACTILHSYSVALSECPCGCRKMKFSEHSLTSKGLRGFCTQSAATGLPRFLHPREVAALLCVPDSLQHCLPVRASNCLLGLIASPLQMVWIYAHVRSSFAKAKLGVSPLTPLEVISAYKAEIKRQLSQSFPFTDVFPGFVHIQATDGSVLHVVSPSACTVGQLLAAEKINLSWGQGQKVVDKLGRTVGLSDMLPTHGPFLLETYDKAQTRERPTGTLRSDVSYCLCVPWRLHVPSASFPWHRVGESPR